MTLNSIAAVCLLLLGMLCCRHFAHYLSTRRKVAFLRQLSGFYLLLCLWMLYNLTVHYAVESQSRTMLSLLLPLDLGIAPLISPLLYFFLRTITGYPPLSVSRKGLHFIYPALAALSMHYFVFQNPDRRVYAYLHDSFDSQPVVYLLRVALCLQAIVYFWLDREMLKRCKQSRDELVVEGHRLQIGWLRIFLLFTMCCLIIHCAFCFLNHSSVQHLHLRLYVFIGWTIVLLTFTVNYTGGNTIGTTLQQSVQTVVTIGSKEKMTKKIPLAKRTQIIESLRTLVETEHLFLNPKCSLDMLATRMDISKNDLSHILNSNGEKGHTDFIHSFRIRYALELIHNKAYRQHTVESIGKMSGFAAASTFVIEFKKRQGVCPREYIAALKERTDS